MDTIAKSLPPASISSRTSCSSIPEIRWRPSSSQLECLRTYFKKCKYPGPEDKASIVREMNEKFSINLDTTQIGNWFQKERIRKSDKPIKLANGIKIYRKFSQEEQNYLMEGFDKCKYPTTESMTETAKKLGVSLCKVENWYKHTRRAFAKEGKITLPERKYYDLEGLSYLKNKFQENAHPSKAELLEMAEHLQCDILQVKNWFANNKKKIRFLGKTSNTKRSLDSILEEKFTEHLVKSEEMVKSEETTGLKSSPSQTAFNFTINQLSRTSPSLPPLDSIPNDNITKKLNVMFNEANNIHEKLQHSNLSLLNTQQNSFNNSLNRLHVLTSNTIQNPIQLNLNSIQPLGLQQQLPLQYAQKHIQVSPQTINPVAQNPSLLYSSTSLQQRLHLNNLIHNLPKHNTLQDSQTLNLLNSGYINNLALARQLQLPNHSQEPQQKYIVFVPVHINQQLYS